MKKIIVTSVLVLVSYFSMAQENILKDAEKWFKEVYVQQNFKDPYSYKLLKISLDSMTNYEYLKNKTNNFMIPHYRKYSAEYKQKLDAEKNKRKPYEVLVKMYEDSYNDYNKKLNKSLSDSTEFANVTENDKKIIHHYIVRIECHANNSYGGQVFGRYSIGYTKENGFDQPVKNN